MRMKAVSRSSSLLLLSLPLVCAAAAAGAVVGLSWALAVVNDGCDAS